MVQPPSLAASGLNIGQQATTLQTQPRISPAEALLPCSSASPIGLAVSFGIQCRLSCNETLQTHQPPVVDQALALIKDSTSICEAQ